MTNTNYHRFTVHTRTRYGVYRLVGTAASSAKAGRMMADEVTKGVAAQVWVRFEDEKVYEWDHEHDTLRDALAYAEAFA